MLPNATESLLGMNFIQDVGMVFDFDFSPAKKEIEIDKMLEDNIIKDTDTRVSQQNFVPQSLRIWRSLRVICMMSNRELKNNKISESLPATSIDKKFSLIKRVT